MYLLHRPVYHSLTLSLVKYFLKTFQKTCFYLKPLAWGCTMNSLKSDWSQTAPSPSMIHRRGVCREPPKLTQGLTSVPQGGSLSWWGTINPTKSWVEKRWKPGSEIWKPGSEIWKPGSEIWKPGSEIWKPGSEIWKTGSEIWKPGFEIWKTGSEIWKSCSEIWKLKTKDMWLKNNKIYPPPFQNWQKWSKPHEIQYTYWET